MKERYSEHMSLINAKTYYKSNEEAASITLQTINDHFDALEALLLDLKLMDCETKCLKEEAGRCVWTMDEKGLSGDCGSHVKNQRAVTARQVGAMRSHTEASFGHITLAPFVSLLGDVAPPFVSTNGASRMKAWHEVWPGANIIATANGSITTPWFAQVLGLFGRHVREHLKIDKSLPVLLCLDSGGGAQLHISAEASLIADLFNIRCFFFR